MMSKFGDYLKNYKQGKHIQQEKTSKAQLAPPAPSYSPLWSQIQAYNQLKTDANTKPTTSECIDDSNRSENLQDTSQPQRSLGILFIIIDELPNELLWRLWLSENSSDISNIRVWIHAKYPERVRSSWIKERLVKSFHLQPDWGSLDLTRVMLGLLDEAIKEAPETQRFVFVSESCIPMISLQKALNAFYPNNTSHQSWMLAKNTANNGFARQKQFDIIEKRIPKQYVWKADQWVLLSRYHAEEIIKLCQYLEEHKTPASTSLSHITRNPIFSLFTGMNASDELFFPTLLSLLGHEFIAPSSSNTNSSNEIIRRCVTFADWSDNGASPKTFVPFNEEDFIEAKDNGTIFFRKMKCQSFNDPHVPREEKLRLVQQWLRITYGKTAGGKKGKSKVGEDEKESEEQIIEEKLMIVESLVSKEDGLLESIEKEKYEREGKRPRLH